MTSWGQVMTHHYFIILPPCPSPCPSPSILPFSSSLALLLTVSGSPLGFSHILFHSLHTFPSTWYVICTAAHVFQDNLDAQLRGKSCHIKKQEMQYKLSETNCSNTPWHCNTSFFVVYKVTMSCCPRKVKSKDQECKGAIILCQNCLSDGWIPLDIPFSLPLSPFFHSLTLFYIPTFFSLIYNLPVGSKSMDMFTLQPLVVIF